MSMFIILRTTKYVGMLADQLAHEEFKDGNKAPLHAPKLIRIAPCVYATSTGNWQIPFDIFSNFREFLLSSDQPRTFDEITQFLKQEGERCYQKWVETFKPETTFKLMKEVLEKLKADNIPEEILKIIAPLEERKALPQNEFLNMIKNLIGQEQTIKFQEPFLKHTKVVNFDIRMPIVLTGRYRHPEDINQGISSTILIYETSNNFTPTRAHGGWYAVTPDLTAILTMLINLPITKMMQMKPLTLIQLLKAMHAFIANISIFVSPQCSVVLIGEEDEYTVFEGQLLSLPARALLF